MSRINDILEELKLYHSSSEKEKLLSALKVNINELILLIKSTNTIENSKEAFITLDEIQFVLARLVFNENLVVSSEFRRFINDFERLDDMAWRDILFKRIKNGYYDFSV